MHSSDMKITYRGFFIRTVRYTDAPGYNAETSQNGKDWDEVSCDVGKTEKQALQEGKDTIDRELEE